MLNQLAKLREERENGENGFTLIELLVVVVIIGILIAIAIPLYLNYKKGAADKSAQSDVRNAVSILEQCNSDNSGYPTAVTFSGAGGTATPCTGQTINLSDNVTMTYYGSASGYAISGYNSNGNTTATSYFCYASAKGGKVKTSTSTFPTSAATLTAFSC